MSGVSASASASPPTFSSPPSISQTTRYYHASNSLFSRPPFFSNLKLRGIRFSGVEGPNKGRICCNSSSTRPDGSSSGDRDRRTVLDAFFLGKAVAEALNERIESTVGEFLSSIGRLQAEQQKQVLDFQDDVLERAKRAKEKASMDAMEAQGFVSSKSSTVNTTPAMSSNSFTSPLGPNAPTAQSEQDVVNRGGGETVLGVSNDD